MHPPSARAPVRKGLFEQTLNHYFKEESVPTETQPVETIELPEKLFILVTYYPELKQARPLFIPFGDVVVGCPVFGERELDEEFMAPEWFDQTALIKEITLESFIKAGEYPIDILREHGDERGYVYMVDPQPGPWEGVEDLGQMYPMRAIAEVLREAIDE